MINNVLDNRYTLLEKIGGGGMAEVYRAHDRLLDRSVAVKVLRGQFTHDEEFVNRFRREAQAAAKLSHPNVVNIYDVGCDGDDHYIVMEYIQGETLKDWIYREGKLPPEMALRIGMEIAEALEHAHQNHLIHCDIKPHNILMTRTGRAKVTDFGIAKAVTSATMTHTGTIIGSVHYFSPEQAKGVMVDTKSDIYSLGVVLYEMLTGQLPFQGDSPIAIALKHIQEDPLALREINPDISPLLEAIVLKMMAKDPSQRIESIEIVLRELKLAQSYLRDDYTRKLSHEDFPTQVLPKVVVPIEDPQAEKILQSAFVDDKSRADRGKRKRTITVAVILLLGIGFMIGAFLSFGKFWSANDVIVPDVVGKPVDVARNILLTHNLRVVVSDAFSEKVPSGQVISQTPEAGSTVKEQRSITLIVSKGGETSTVPDVRGLNRRDAEAQIQAAGMVLGRVEEQSSPDAAADIVISQNPRGATPMAKGTIIDLVISKGNSPRKIVLPDFKGTALQTVLTQLEGLKLKQGNVTEVSSDKPAGSVVSQTPSAGVEISEGSNVDLSVSKGNNGGGKRGQVQIVVPDGPSRQPIQIVVTDANGRRLVYESFHKPGDRVEKTVEGTGQVRVQIYINGTLAQEQTL